MSTDGHDYKRNQLAKPISETIFCDNPNCQRGYYRHYHYCPWCGKKNKV